MTSWKDFKNWLEKEIIISGGLKVRIKPDKKVFYGELSEIILTDFMDSLDATLDNNSNYHLFPTLNEDSEFRDLFSINNCYFGKKVGCKWIKSCDYLVLENLFNDWKNEKKKASKQMRMYENEYKWVDNFLGRKKREYKICYYVDTDGYVYNDLNIRFRIEQKEAEVNWLKEQLKKVLGEEQYQSQIEIKYPEEFLKFK